MSLNSTFKQAIKPIDAMTKKPTLFPMHEANNTIEQNPLRKIVEKLFKKEIKIFVCSFGTHQK